MRRFINRLWRECSGVSAIEFAMIMPFLAALAIGTIEFGRLILLTQKLQNSSFTLADLAARDKTLSEGQITDIFLALGKIIEPFEFEHSGTATITSVSAKPDGTKHINWQRSGGGDLAVTSDLGTQGHQATLPSGLTMVTGETLIVAEVFYDYQPIFGLLADPSVLHRISFFKPRLGTLETLLP